MGSLEKENTPACAVSAEGSDGSLFAWSGEVSLCHSDHVVRVLFWWKNLLVQDEGWIKPESGSSEFWQ